MNKSELTLDTLKQHLSKIKYEIKGTDPNRWIYDNFGKNTGWLVHQDSIEYRHYDGIKMSIVIAFKDSEIEFYDQTVSVGKSSAFVNFYNFTLKQLPNEQIRHTKSTREPKQLPNEH